MSRARTVMRSTDAFVVFPVVPLRYVSVPLRISKLPMPNAVAAPDAAPLAVPGADAAPNSQFPRPFASVSSVITGSTSVNSMTSKRRDSNGSNAI